MKKKIPIFLVLMLAVYSLSAVAYEYPVLDKQVEIRQAHLKWVTTVLEVSMEATIEYIDEISDGAGTSDLTSLLGDFREQTGEIETLTTHVALNNAIRQLGEITGDFRTETRQQLIEYKGNGLQLLAKIQEALDENEDELDELEDEYWETAKENTLEIFDIYVDFAQDVLDKLQEHGYDITEAQEKLDEIKYKKDDLEDALESRDYDEIKEVISEIKELSEELGDIVRDLQVEVPPKKIIEYWINVCSRAVYRTDTIIDELETLGFDVTELREIHGKAEAHLEEAEDEFNAGDLDGALEALKDVKQDFIELREAYDDLIFGGELPADMEAKVESVSNALDDIVDEMDESL